MSGSTIGGIVGGVIGFYFGNPQLGWMIGSAVGGYVDPEKIEGPRLTDAQTQTSMEGAPRCIVYGTAVVAGNVIQAGPLVEHKEEDNGKGGPVQVTYTYTRSFAVRVCEGPIGGITRIWFDNKLVYDARDPADWPDAAADISAMAGDTARLASQIAIYLGGETQLPDATLEALPAENGGGSGFVPSHRGTAYVVFQNLDLTQRSGSIPQIKFEVSACGTTTAGTAFGQVFSLGVDTNAYLLKSDTGEAWDAAETSTPGIAGLFTACHGGALFVIGNSTTGTAGNRARVSFNRGATWLAVSGLDDLGANGASSMTYTGTTWTVFGYSGDAYYSTNGLAFSPATVPAGNLYSGANIGQTVICGSTNQRVFRSLDGGRTFATWTTVGTFGPFIGVELIVRVPSGFVAFGGGEAAFLADGGSWVACADFPVGMSTPQAVAVDAGGGILAVGRDLGETVYSADNGASWTLGASLGLAISATTDNALVYANGAFVITADQAIFRTTNNGASWTQVYTKASGSPGANVFSTAVIDMFFGTAIPDAPGYYVDSDGNVQGPGNDTVSTCAPTVAEVVTDICSRVGITSAQIDVSQLTAEVRGMVIGKQVPAAEAIRSLQQAYFFDFPEWGDYTDTGTKLRGILRGGSYDFTITDDDLVESDEDEDTRPQAVEFARKLNLITADVDADYNPTKQTAERRTENIKAVGEATVELPFSLTRDEAAPKAEIMLKVMWAEAEGRTQFKLPEEFSAMVPSDTFMKDGKRWRAEEIEYGDGIVSVKAVRDRVSAYSSSATSGSALSPSAPTSGLRGPTVCMVMNLPRLRSQDSTPGVYVGVQGLLAGWPGCTLMLSVDGGASEQAVATITTPSVIGELTADCGSSGEPISVKAYYGGSIDSVTTEQIDARMNAFAIVSDDVAEIGQVQTVTEGAEREYDWTDITRPQLGTTASAHTAGDRFIMLDETLRFIPLDISLAGKTLIFRAVTLGTVPANNDTVSLVFDPQFTLPQEIEVITVSSVPVTVDGQQLLRILPDA